MYRYGQQRPLRKSPRSPFLADSLNTEQRTWGGCLKKTIIIYSDFQPLLTANSAPRKSSKINQHPHWQSGNHKNYFNNKKAIILIFRSQESSVFFHSCSVSLLLQWRRVDEGSQGTYSHWTSTQSKNPRLKYIKSNSLGCGCGVSWKGKRNRILEDWKNWNTFILWISKSIDPSLISSALGCISFGCLVMVVE